MCRVVKTRAGAPDFVLRVKGSPGGTFEQRNEGPWVTFLRYNLHILKLCSIIIQ